MTDEQTLAELILDALGGSELTAAAIATRIGYPKPRPILAELHRMHREGALRMTTAKNGCVHWRFNGR